MSQVNANASRLKEEGNKLFSQKKYALASVKYSEAIAIDGNNAILYANRSASRFALKQYAFVPVF